MQNIVNGIGNEAVAQELMALWMEYEEGNYLMALLWIEY